MTKDRGGYSAFKSIVDNRFLGGYPSSFLDVGANIGQTVRAVKVAFPDARVVAVEPVPESYRKLVENVAGEQNVRTANIALGAADGQIRMTARGVSTGNYVISEREDVTRVPCITVPTMRGDTFLKEMELTTVGYLKIDTEGYDLEVLKGFAASLQRQLIDYVEVEAGLSCDNARHVPFELLKQYLEALDYRLLQIKDVAAETHFKGLANLRRCNLVFASKALLERERVAPTRLAMLQKS
ncbi:FkbM family methyltransferase [Brevundimonas sp.]|uniref:FkbM family methyltransferase n=1 Tax=Brevundimonas sp. TaxID=1871086 RepID=UPI0028A9C3DF|nr:FkbM family methyltransferase [Brevundimonas sp.]